MWPRNWRTHVYLWLSLSLCIYVRTVMQLNLYIYIYTDAALPMGLSAHMDGAAHTRWVGGWREDPLPLNSPPPIPSTMHPCAFVALFTANNFHSITKKERGRFHHHLFLVGRLCATKRKKGMCVALLLFLDCACKGCFSGETRGFRFIDWGLCGVVDEIW